MKEKCKNCAHPSKACISYLMTLSTKEMLEWCRMWKERLGWSNATLAEKSHVPKGTIDRIMLRAKSNDNSAGVKLFTIRPILCALTGCSLEELESCDNPQDSNIAVLVDQNKRLEEEIQRLKKDADSQDTQRSFLAGQIKVKDRYIAVLVILLLLALTIIFIALIIDKFNPDLGFIWRTPIS